MSDDQMTAGDASLRLGEVFAATAHEYARAKSKHGDYVIDGPLYTDAQRFAVLGEEVGEVAHELTYDAGPAGAINAEALYSELIQVATMALAWAAEVKRRGDS